MGISDIDVLTFYKHLDDAKVFLSHEGERGTPYIDRLKAIRGTFNPKDIDSTFVKRLGEVADDLEEMAQPQMSAVAKGQPIQQRERSPSVDKAIASIRSAISYLMENATSTLR